MKNLVFITFLISMTIIASASGLTCYQCLYAYPPDSGIDHDPRCKDGEVEATPELLVECPVENSAACLKLSAEGGGMLRVLRGCASFEEAAELGCTEVDEGDVTGTICYCETDSCNGSNTSLTYSLF